MGSIFFIFRKPKRQIETDIFEIDSLHLSETPEYSGIFVVFSKILSYICMNLLSL